MCGILFNHRNRSFTKEEVNVSLNALDEIQHRGPDGEGALLLNSKTGEWKMLKLPNTPKNIESTDLNDISSLNGFDTFFGHKRLSILDLESSGHQPMVDDSGSILIFNGEIYNYRELKEELLETGHKFRSNSDTEVILKAWKEWGTNCFSKFNGMWSIILWCAKSKEFILSNDRYGVKPLFYHENKDEVILSSEIRQILAFKHIERSLNKNAIETFIEASRISYDLNTFFQNIHRFKPSNYVVFDNAKSINNSYKSYYSIFDSKVTKMEEDTAIEAFRDLLFQATSIRTRSDVDWGVGLSGGLDSSAVLFYTNKFIVESGKGRKPKTFSAIFPNKYGDESEFISRMTDVIDVDKQTVNPLDLFTEEDFVNHIKHQELPVLTTSFYSQYCVARLIRENDVTVNLVGQGADEVFGGYHQYFYRYCRQLILKGKVFEYVHIAKDYASLKEVDLKSIHKIVLGEVKVATKFKLGLAKFSNKLEKEWNNINRLKDFMKMDFTSYQLPYFLHSDDRTAMAFSVETRHPFLDYRLVDFGNSVPENLLIRKGWQKYLMRAAMKELPKAIRWRKDKKGFTSPEKDILEKGSDFFNEYSNKASTSLGFVNNESDKVKLASLGVWLELFEK